MCVLSLHSLLAGVAFGSQPDPAEEFKVWEDFLVCISFSSACCIFIVTSITLKNLYRIPRVKYFMKVKLNNLCGNDWLIDWWLIYTLQIMIPISAHKSLAAMTLTLTFKTAKIKKFNMFVLLLIFRFALSVRYRDINYHQVDLNGQSSSIPTY